MSTPDVTEPNLAVEAARQVATVLGLLQAGDVPTALAAAEQVDRRAAHLDDPLTQARILYQLAEMLDKAGLRDEARPYFEHSLALSQTMDSRLAHLGAGMCLQRLGAIHRDAGRLSEAMDCYRHSIEHFQAMGDLVHVGNAWNNLGLVQHQGGDLEAAEDSYRRALVLGEQTGDVRLHATSLGNLGKVALDRYHFSEAERRLRSAISLTQTLDDQVLLASQVGDLGNVLRAQGRSAKAEHCYEEALRLAEAQGDRRGQQLALGNLGALYQERGELGRALFYLERSYTISRKHGSASDQVADLIHLALVRQELGERVRALEDLQAALALAEEAAADLLPGVLNVLGHLMLEKGELAQAEDIYRQCLATEEQIGDTYNAGTSWLNLGCVAWQQNDSDGAMACWHEALEQHEAAGNRSGLATAHLNLGSALLTQEDFAGAEAHLRAALDIAEVFPLPDDARLAWESLALLRWRQGNLIKARAAYDQAIAWAEQSRAAVTGQHHRIAFWPALKGPYLGLIQLSLTSGDRRCAWEAVQKARSRALSELLGSSRLPVPNHLPVRLCQREEELLARLRRIQALIAGHSSPDGVAELLDLDATLDALWAEMEPLAPEYAALRRGTPPQFDVVVALLA
jgi:tetratricopeptide (TPR) repeat protein